MRLFLLPNVVWCAQRKQRSIMQHSMTDSFPARRLHWESQCVCTLSLMCCPVLKTTHCSLPPAFHRVSCPTLLKGGGSSLDIQPSQRRLKVHLAMCTCQVTHTSLAHSTEYMQQCVRVQFPGEV
jgi:hypothetical protein